MEPRRLLVAGDTHGDIVFVRALFQVAKSYGCEAIVQLGDFGFWEHEPSGVLFLDQVAELCFSHQLPFIWLDGNHENHTLLRARYAPGMVTSPCAVPHHPPNHAHQHEETTEGFWPIRPGLFYAPRGARWSWHGKRFLAVGGAYSIDKAWRLAEERAPGTLWWPEEELTEAELHRICADPSPVDVLLAHDAPWEAEPEGLLPIAESVPNRQRLRTICEVVTPKLVLHGHLHRRSSQVLHLNTGPVQVEGLASNIEKLGAWLRLQVAD